MSQAPEGKAMEEEDERTEEKRRAREKLRPETSANQSQTKCKKPIGGRPNARGAGPVQLGSGPVKQDQ